MHVATKKAPLRRGFLLRVDHQIGRPIRGLSLGRYLAPRRRVSISMTMKPAATICGLQNSTSREVSGGTGELEKRANPTIRSLQGYA